MYISKDVIFDELTFPFPRLFGEPDSISSTTAVVSSSQQTLTVLSTLPTGVTPPTLDNPTPAEKEVNLQKGTPETLVEVYSDYRVAEEDNEHIQTLSRTYNLGVF